MDTIQQQILSQLNQANGEVRRLFHGRSGLWPSYEWLVVDYFPPVAVIREFSPDATHAQVVTMLADLLAEQVDIEAVVWQQRWREGQVSILHGHIDSKHVVSENGLQFEVDTLARQNNGLFLDMRAGREWVRAHAQGKRVLNLFAYTCGFSVAAAVGGAESVVNLDMSSHSLSQGRRNHALNAQLNSAVQTNVSYLALDLLKSWSRVKRHAPYDLIVIDPPSFQKGSFVATKDYQKVVRRLDSLSKSGTYVLTCHNDPLQSSSFLRELYAELAPEFSFCEQLSRTSDFPEVDEHDAGLKVLVFQRG